MLAACRVIPIRNGPTPVGEARSKSRPGPRRHGQERRFESPPTHPIPGLHPPSLDRFGRCAAARRASVPARDIDRNRDPCRTATPPATGVGDALPPCSAVSRPRPRSGGRGPPPPVGSPGGLTSLRFTPTAPAASAAWFLRPAPSHSARLLRAMLAPGHPPRDESVDWTTLVARHSRSSGAPGAATPPTRSSTPLVVTGEHDVFLSPWRLAPAVHGTLGAELGVVPEAGHRPRHWMSGVARCSRVLWAGPRALWGGRRRPPGERRARPRPPGSARGDVFARGCQGGAMRPAVAVRRAAAPSRPGTGGWARELPSGAGRWERLLWRGPLRQVSCSPSRGWAVSTPRHNGAEDPGMFRSVGKILHSLIKKSR